jgi:hypothetical protein
MFGKITLLKLPFAVEYWGTGKYLIYVFSQTKSPPILHSTLNGGPNDES